MKSVYVNHVQHTHTWMFRPGYNTLYRRTSTILYSFEKKNAYVAMLMLHTSVCVLVCTRKMCMSIHVMEKCPMKLTIQTCASYSSKRYDSNTHTYTRSHILTHTHTHTPLIPTGTCRLHWTASWRGCGYEADRVFSPSNGPWGEREEGDGWGDGGRLEEGSRRLSLEKCVEPPTLMQSGAPQHAGRQTARRPVPLLCYCQSSLIWENTHTHTRTHTFTFTRMCADTHKKRHPCDFTKV